MLIKILALWIERPRPSSPVKRFAGLFIIVMLLNSNTAGASPWIDAGDVRARHHLQVLGDAGVIDLPLTTWPVMWRGVSRELDAVDAAALSEAERESYVYLKRAQRRARPGLSASQEVSAHSSRPGLLDYSADSRERLESRTHLGYTGERLAFRLEGSVVGDPIDGKRYRLDGSYVAARLGNWALGAGAIDRWWGPGWQSSLILSTNARPSPGLFVSREDARAFEHPLLRWLGPWDLRMFMNQLEGDRGTPHAKLAGMRVSFKPWPRLEIGLSRTAQWGGQGRPENPEVFWNMLLGRDNRGSSGIDEDMSNEPGNQLAGYDWRWSHTAGGLASAFYGQLIGEDEAGGLPYRFLGMAGVETSFVRGAAHHRLALEASNTTMEFDNDGIPNVAYEHPLYPSGYRYYGRPLGATTDNDSELIVLKGWHGLPRNHHLRWTLGTATLNRDGTNRQSPAGNVLAEDTVDLWYATAHYTLPLADHSELSLGAQYYNTDLHLADERIETGAYIGYSYVFGGR